MPKSSSGSPPITPDLPKFKSRKTWKNVTGNQHITPLRFFQPRTLGEIQAIIIAAEKEGLRVRAVGSGYSFSRVALTDGYMMDPSRMNKILDLPREHLKAEHREKYLVHVEGGIKLHYLNKLLDQKMGLALSSMGTVAVQTISGAISTGTHGTGWNMPSLPDMVRSLTLVTHGGKVFQIEPTDGITDPDSFSRPGVILVQNDDWFYSSVVSMGAMGVVYSVVLEVEPIFWLNEKKTKMNVWMDVEDQVKDGSIFKNARHVSLRINPYPRRQENYGARAHSVQAIEMDEVPPFTQIYNNLNQRFRNFKAYIAGTLPGLADIIVHFQNKFPRIIPGTIEASINGSQDKTYKNISYKVFNQGIRQIQKRGLSSEWAFPLSSGNHVEAVRQAFAIVQKAMDQGKLYQNSPISMRVAPPSKHYLATSYGERVVYVEFPMVIGTKGAEEMLDRYQEAMIALKGRPHWGKFHNRLVAADKLIPPLYEKWDTWCEIYLELNPHGTFDNQFTDRMGFRTTAKYAVQQQQQVSFSSDSSLSDLPGQVGQLETAH
ncbi:MAG: FAD-binding protein [Bacteroidia bacterium]|nr:FAD-binding protein [Bacteroidia bacterium]